MLVQAVCFEGTMSVWRGLWEDHQARLGPFIHLSDAGASLTGVYLMAFVNGARLGQRTALSSQK